jgi:hypothetical protein
MANFQADFQQTRYELEVLKVFNDYHRAFKPTGNEHPEFDVKLEYENPDNIIKYEVKTNIDYIFNTGKGQGYFVEFCQRSYSNRSKNYVDPKLITNLLKSNNNEVQPWFDSGIKLSESDNYIYFTKSSTQKNLYNVTVIPTSVLKDEISKLPEELKTRIQIEVETTRSEKNVYVPLWDDDINNHFFKSMGMTKDGNNRALGFIISYDYIRRNHPEFLKTDENGELLVYDLDKNNELITERYVGCVNEDGQVYQYFQHGYNEGNVSISDLMNDSCDNIVEVVSSSDEDDRKEDWYKYGKNKEWFYSASGKGLELMNLIKK